MSIKKQIKMIIALICVVCFVVLLVSAIHINTHATHAGNAGISANPCQRTLLPECKCESAIAPIPVQVQTHEHNGSHVDCFICIIVQKTVDQIRHISIAEIPASDLTLLVMTGLCFMFILAGVSTPVKLKTRTNN